MEVRFPYRARDMRQILIVLIVSFFGSCSIPSLARSPLEFLGLFRFFSNQTKPGEFALGGAVSGLFSGSSVILKNGSESLTISSDGNFTFSQKLKTGTTYDVSVTVSGNSGMACTLSNGKGTMQTSDITNVSVTCGWGSDYYEVGVSVSGIASSITVQNNASESLSFSSAALYKFSTRIKTGSSYAVTITSQTTGQVCSFSDPKLSVGTIPTSNVTVFIRCINGYLNGGTIHNVAAANLFSNLAAPNLYLRTMVGSYPINAGGGGAAPGNNPIGIGSSTANAALLSSPAGMASDGTYVYLADRGNNIIRKIDKTNGTTTNLAGGATVAGGTTCPGVTTTNCLDGIGLAAKFNEPFALATDGTSLYVLEFLGNRIRRINLATAEVTTLAGNGNTAPFANNTDGLQASFNNPHGMTLYNGFLYIADRYNHRIRAVNTVTSEVTTFAGTGTAGHLDLSGASAQFNSPIGIVALGGYLYVTDNGNERIRQISLSGTNPVTTFAGQAAAGTSDGYGTGAQFSGPFGIATDGTNLVISEYITYKIRHIRVSDAKVTTLVGGTVGYADNAGLNAQMQRPAYLTSDGLNIYLTEEANHALRRIEDAELLRYTFDGNSNDSIGTNHGTLTGAPTLVSDEHGTASGAYQFDGASQLISSTSNVQFNGSALTDNLTMSAWVFPSGGAGTQFIFYNGTGGMNGYGLAFQAGTRNLYVSLGLVGGSGNTTSKLPLNRWSHVALTRNSGNWQIYINGLSEGIVFNSNPNPPLTSFKVADAGNGFYFKGKISDARFFHGALDPTAIQKLAIQVPSGLVAYYPLNGNSNDYSGNGNDLTTNGAPTLAFDRSGLSNQAYSFVAPNDYLEKASPNLLPTGNASRTTCAWVRATSTPSNIVSFGVTGAGQMNGLALGNSAILHYGYTNPFDHVTDHFYLQNRWVHICGTYDGTDSRIYYNGALQSTTPYVWTTGVSALLRIGRNISAVEFFDGSIDDVRIYNRVLTSSEIFALTGPHPLQIGNMQLHLQADSLNAPAVVNWLDNSPNNTTAAIGGGNSVSQPNASYQPTWSSSAINGTPGVIFNVATSTHLTNSSGSYYGLGTDTFSFFIVNSRSSIGTVHVPMSLGPPVGGKAFLFDDSGLGNCGNLSQFAIAKSAISCAAKSTSSFSSTGIQSIFSISYDSTSAIASPFYWDTTGAEGSTVTPGLSFIAPSGGTGITVGARYTPVNYFDGIISEMIYFNQILTTAEADSVRCYLSAKYNIRIANSCP